MINKLSKYVVYKFGKNLKLKFLVHIARSRRDRFSDGTDFAWNLYSFSKWKDYKISQVCRTTTERVLIVDFKIEGYVILVLKHP